MSIYPLDERLINENVEKNLMTKTEEIKKIQSADNRKGSDNVGEDPKFLDWYGNLPLHNAVIPDSPNLERVKILIAKFPEGAQIRNQFGRIPLHYAVDRSQSKVSAEVIKLLLAAYPKGSSESANDGITPYKLSLRWCHSKDILKLHLKSDPDLDPETLENITYGPAAPLYRLAFRKSSYNIVEPPECKTEREEGEVAPPSSDEREESKMSVHDRGSVYSEDSSPKSNRESCISSRLISFQESDHLALIEDSKSQKELVASSLFSIQEEIRIHQMNDTTESTSDTSGVLPVTPSNHPTDMRVVQSDTPSDDNDKTPDINYSINWQSGTTHFIRNEMIVGKEQQQLHHQLQQPPPPLVPSLQEQQEEDESGQSTTIIVNNNYNNPELQIPPPSISAVAIPPPEISIQVQVASVSVN